MRPAWRLGKEFVVCIMQKKKKKKKKKKPARGQVVQNKIWPTKSSHFQAIIQNLSKPKPNNYCSKMDILERPLCIMQTLLHMQTMLK